MRNFEEYNSLNESYDGGWRRGSEPPRIPDELWKDVTIPSDLLYKDKLQRLVVKNKKGETSKLFPEPLRKRFLKKVVWIAEELDLNPNYLMAIIGFETAGTFSSTEKNEIGATGYIQFTNSTASDTFGLKSASDIPKDPIRQLDFVYYFLKANSKDRNWTPKTLSDHYIGLVWLPSYAKKKDSTDISNYYEKNEGLFKFYPKDSTKFLTLGNVRNTVDSGRYSSHFKKAIEKEYGNLATAYEVIANKSGNSDDAKIFRDLSKKYSKEGQKDIAKAKAIEAAKPVNIKKQYKTIEDIGIAIAKNPQNLTHA